MTMPFRALLEKNVLEQRFFFSRSSWAMCCWRRSWTRRAQARGGWRCTSGTSQSSSRSREISRRGRPSVGSWPWSGRISSRTPEWCCPAGPSACTLPLSRRTTFGRGRLCDVRKGFVVFGSFLTWLVFFLWYWCDLIKGRDRTGSSIFSYWFDPENRALVV